MNTFNTSRFLTFFINECRVTARQTALLWGAMILFAFTVCFFNHNDNKGIELSRWIFWSVIVFFWVWQGFNISIQLGVFTSKTRKTALLLQPISKTEFLTAKMLYCFVLFPLLYIAYIVGVAELISLYNTAYFNIAYLSGSTLGTLQYLKEMAHIALFSWSCTTALYWTGSFYFGRYAVVKTTLSLAALYAGLMGFSYIVMGLCFGFWDSLTSPFHHYGHWVNTIAGLEITLLLSSLMLVVISVFKYKEKTL